ncbi:unnamed protein product [marine sediment metagenome]|uniref:KTSC domain-containing protein n=1 Tax=marine sediment metagenome TaxID=412755 RepID=X1BY95_9ZZZZ
MPGIKMIPVVSSNVESIGYDEKTRRLGVKFLRGAAYVYADVPLEKWQGCDLGGSVGKWLHKEIIGKYASEKVQEATNVRSGD